MKIIPVCMTSDFISDDHMFNQPSGRHPCIVMANSERRENTKVFVLETRAIVLVNCYLLKMHVLTEIPLIVPIVLTSSTENGWSIIRIMSSQ